ncbi:MAG: electron transfer flavoprotein subunit alpha/FixB family protein, partial [Bacteroidetes bacterium]|nr:electron transfer flavoprotein subunit alpha/FixB family protein [Bacteroidota bacterium]
MSILVYIEIQDGKIKKSSLEAVSYAKNLIDSSVVNAVVIGNADPSVLSEIGKYGADKVYHLSNSGAFDSSLYASTIVEVAQTTSAEWV